MYIVIIDCWFESINMKKVGHNDRTLHIFLEWKSTIDKSFLEDECLH